MIPTPATLFIDMPQAEWHGTTVAVKELLTDEDDDDEDEVRRFLEFQKEVTIQGSM
jgi:hypothetical protein